MCALYYWEEVTDKLKLHLPAGNTSAGVIVINLILVYKPIQKNLVVLLHHVSYTHIVEVHSDGFSMPVCSIYQKHYFVGGYVFNFLYIYLYVLYLYVMCTKETLCNIFRIFYMAGILYRLVSLCGFSSVLILSFPKHS